jgi:hypothetical protein
MMPPGTIFAMNEDELMELLAYLISSGNEKHEVFTDPPSRVSSP